MNLDRKLAVVALFVGVALLFAGLGIFLSQGAMSPSVSYTLIAGVALLICYGLLAPTAVLDLVRNRQARFGSLTVVVSAIAIGILVMANVLAARTTQAVDLTGAKRYTLSEKTVTVLRHLDSDVTVTGFFRPGTNTTDLEDARSLLAEYRKASGRVKVSVVNPDTHAEEARKLGVTINGSFAVQYKNKQPTVLLLGSQSETDFTSAILKLEAARTPQVCWASGDGERDLTVTQDYGYSEAKRQLGSDNFTIKQAVLSQSASVPADCDILAVVGLQAAIPGPMATAIQRYVNQGGSLLLALDPWSDSGIAQSANAIVHPYGATFQNGLVIEGDASRYAQGDSSTPVVFSYGASPLAKDLANKVTFFPQTTAIAQDDADGVTSITVAQTTGSAYQIMSERDTNQLARRPGDKPGPFTIMETLEKALPPGTQGGGVTGTKKGRVVLVGTSAFAENLAITAQSGYNLELMLGTFDWLAGNDQLIALPSKPPAAAPLLLTDQESAINFLIVVVLLPLAILLAGAGVYLRRRRTFAPA